MDESEADENIMSEAKSAENDRSQDQVNTQDNNHSQPSQEVKNSRLGEASFLAILGGSVKKYWKIGIHWLAALRDLLAFPFDARARRILQNSA